jgi:hypothetical protein
MLFQRHIFRIPRTHMTMPHWCVTVDDHAISDEELLALQCRSQFASALHQSFRFRLIFLSPFSYAKQLCSDRPISPKTRLHRPPVRGFASPTRELSRTQCFPHQYRSHASHHPSKLCKNSPSYRSYECVQQPHTRRSSSVHRCAVVLGPTKVAHHRSSPSLRHCAVRDLCLSSPTVRCCFCDAATPPRAIAIPYPPQYPHSVSTYPSQKPVRKNLFSFST